MKRLLYFTMIMLNALNAMEHPLQNSVFLELPLDMWKTIIQSNDLSYHTIGVLKTVNKPLNDIIQFSFISTEAVQKEKSFVCTERLIYLAEKYKKDESDGVKTEFFNIFHNNCKDKRLTAQHKLWELTEMDRKKLDTLSMHCRKTLSKFFYNPEKKAQLFKEIFSKDETIELILLSALKDDFAMFCWGNFFWDCVMISLDNDHSNREIEKLLRYPEIAQFINVNYDNISLVSQGYEGCNWKETPHSIAIMYAKNSEKTFSNLLNCPYVNINEQQVNGNTVLHELFLQFFNPLSCLLNHKQSVNWFIENNKGETPFDLFCDKGGMKLLTILSQVFIDAKKRQIMSDEDINQVTELYQPIQSVQFQLLDQKEKTLDQKEKNFEYSKNLLLIQTFIGGMVFTLFIVCLRDFCF